MKTGVGPVFLGHVRWALDIPHLGINSICPRLAYVPVRQLGIWDDRRHNISQTPKSARLTCLRSIHALLTYQ